MAVFVDLKHRNPPWCKEEGVQGCWGPLPVICGSQVALSPSRTQILNKQVFDYVRGGCWDDGGELYGS